MTHPSAPAQPRLNHLRSVLIIDDDDDDVFIIEERLSDFVAADCQFHSCKDKHEAISQLKTNHFDLCLLDHRLGYFDGIEVLEALGDEMIVTPIIMLTGQDDELVENQAIKMGAQDYIMKSSIDSAVFAKSIRYAVSRKELEFARINGERFRSENVAKDKFIAHLSHELRTPLTSILGYTSLLLENDVAAPLNKELSIIANNGKHLLNLLNDVLDLSKIAAGKFELQLRETDLHQLVAEVYSLLTVNALDKGLAFECKTITPIARLAVIDELRLKQVLINLISNSIKFTDRGTVSMTLEQSENTALTIKVKDSGIGMGEEQMESIFQPFTQIEDVAERKAGGAGLGLSISLEIVRQMGGDISVHSRLGQGTEFTVEVPLNIKAGTQFAHFDFDLHKGQTKAETGPRLKGKVLIVDDVFEIRQLLGQYVKQTGCEVHFARNGQKAIDAILQADADATPFDLVLMDLHMPVMTGQQAVKILSRSHPSLPVIAITAAIQKGTRDELFKAGFSELLAKPVERLALWKVLKHHLLSQEKDEAKRKQIEEADSHVNKICLVEDDEDAAQLMRILLKKLDFDVEHFADAQSCLEALPKLEHHHFLVDLGLPDMPGQQLIERIRQSMDSVKITVLSGSQPEQSFLDKHNVHTHLLKPISLDKLKALL